MNSLPELSLLRDFPKDGGMLYAETDLSQTFPEPFNFASSLLFLVIAGYGLWKIWGQYRTYSFLTYCLFLLLIGAIGGGVYHGFRLWRPFIMMDWLPIMLLCISASIHFLVRVSRWYVAVFLVGLYMGFTFWMRSSEVMQGDLQFWINLNYTFMASLVVLPVLWFLGATSFRFGWNVLFALLSFSAAIFFRIMDQTTRWEIGTHFLWHTFGALATALMLRYVYLVRKRELAISST